MDSTVNAESVFRFFIINRMPADKAGPGLHDLVMATSKDFFEKAHIKLLGRKHHDIKSRNRFAAHRVDVRDGVGRSNLAEPVRIINRRGDKINRVDHGHFVGQAIHRCIIRGFYTDQQVGVVRGGESGKRVRQIRRTDFSRSTAGASQSCQGFFLKQQWVNLLV